MPQDTIRAMRKPLPETENSLAHKPNEIITEPNYKVQGPDKCDKLAMLKKSVMPPPIILFSVTSVRKETSSLPTEGNAAYKLQQEGASYSMQCKKKKHCNGQK